LAVAIEKLINSLQRNSAGLSNLRRIATVRFFAEASAMLLGYWWN
jgi:hypothetical protein